MVALGANDGGGYVTATVFVTSSVEVTVTVVRVDAPPPQPVRNIAAAAMAVFLRCSEEG